MDAFSRARPLAEIPADDARGIAVLATDFDGTLTSDGKMPAVAYAALWRAHEARVSVVLVTGRSAGFADHAARAWPVAGVVAESGAMACGLHDGRMVRYDLCDRETRAANRAKLDALGREVLATVAGIALASDQPYREYDLALDFSEDVAARLPPEELDRIVAWLEARGCRAQYSSAHVNAWLGDYDKAGMLVRFLREHLDVDVEAEPRRVIYAGDALNDQPLFRAFPISAGVANLADVRDRLVHPPTYVSVSRGGEGFAEIVDAILEPRTRQD